MELHEQVIIQAIADNVIPKLRIDAAALMDMKCYQTLLRIYDIVSDDTLDDSECFFRVEQIVCALDDLGIGVGGRHDFG